MRIILKFSGESLGGNDSYVDFDILRYIVTEIKPLIAKQIEIGIVVGGGNLFRGANLHQVDRVTGDQMGMLSTVINGLALRDAFIKEKIDARVLSAFEVPGITEIYDRNNALKYLAEKEILIFTGGTGNPLVTTDTALSLRGIELKADLLLKATNVDGIYSANPKENPNAKFYPTLTYAEVLEKRLEVMDLAAFCLCKDHDMILRVYNMRKANALLDIVSGKDEGTVVRNN